MNILNNAMLLTVTTAPVGGLDLTAPAVPEQGSGYMPRDPMDFGAGLLELAGQVLGTLRPDLREAAGVCLSLCAGVLLISIVNAISDRARKTVELAGTAAISASLLLSTNSMILLGSRTITDMSEYGKLLLPVMTAAMAAHGGGVTSAALYSGTAFFLSLLSSLIGKLLLPMVYLFLALTVASGALDADLLKRLRELIRWVLSRSLKLLLTVFTAYLGLTRVISGTADAAAVKAAKAAISTAVPVVGSVLANASETVLIGAAMVKNAAGMYGIFALLALFAQPFARIGVQYLMLKITGAVCSLFGCQQMTQLIDGFSEAMGLILAMVGSVCVLLLVGAICFLMGVG